MTMTGGEKKEKAKHCRRVRGVDFTCCAQNNEFFIPSEDLCSEEFPEGPFRPNTGSVSMFADIQETQPVIHQNISLTCTASLFHARSVTSPFLVPSLAQIMAP